MELNFSELCRLLTLRIHSILEVLIDNNNLMGVKYTHKSHKVRFLVKLILLIEFHKLILEFDVVLVHLEYIFRRSHGNIRPHQLIRLGIQNTIEFEERH